MGRIGTQTGRGRTCSLLTSGMVARRAAMSGASSTASARSTAARCGLLSSASLPGAGTSGGAAGAPAAPGSMDARRGGWGLSHTVYPPSSAHASSLHGVTEMYLING